MHRTHSDRLTRRRTGTLLTFTTVTLLLAACGSDEARPGEATSSPLEPAQSSSGTELPERPDADLVVWAPQDVLATVEDVAKTFGQDAEATVAVQEMPEEALAAVLSANAAGTGPDVVVGPHHWIGTMVQNGAVAPLRLTETDQQRYVATALDGVRHSDTLYGLPYALQAVALFRNTDLVPRAPRTIEDLAALAEASGAEHPLCLPVGPDGDAYHLQPLYSSAGGYLFGVTSDGSHNVTDLGVGKEGSLTAATKLAELGAQGVLSTTITEENSIELFTSGRCAFLQAGPGALDDVRGTGVPYAVGPVVGFAGLHPARPFTDVQAFFVTTKGHSPDLAQRFVLDAVNSPQAMTALHQAERRPPAMGVVLRAAAADDPEVQVFADVAAAGQVMPSVPQIDAVWEPLGQAEAAIIDGADPVSTMLGAATAISERTS